MKLQPKLVVKRRIPWEMLRKLLHLLRTSNLTVAMTDILQSQKCQELLLQCVHTCPCSLLPLPQAQAVPFFVFCCSAGLGLGSVLRLLLPQNLTVPCFVFCCSIGLGLGWFGSAQLVVYGMHMGQHQPIPKCQMKIYMFENLWNTHGRTRN